MKENLRNENVKEIINICLRATKVSIKYLFKTNQILI